jgi:hypothetical protein
MMSDLSVWLSNHYDALKDFAGPVATVIAASAAMVVTSRIGKNQVAVAVSQAEIAEKNWQVGRDKVMLDLFDRRMAVYDDVRNIMTEIMQHGTVRRTTLMYEFARAVDRIDILFGPEVSEYIAALRKEIAIHHSAEVAMERPRNEDARQAAIERQFQSFENLMKFFDEFPALIKGYVAMHQKAELLG